jgi:hypothetical protein
VDTTIDPIIPAPATTATIRAGRDGWGIELPGDIIAPHAGCGGVVFV